MKKVVRDIAKGIVDGDEVAVHDFKKEGEKTRTSWDDTWQSGKKFCTYLMRIKTL